MVECFFAWLCDDDREHTRECIRHTVHMETFASSLTETNQYSNRIVNPAGVRPAYWDDANQCIVTRRYELYTAVVVVVVGRKHTRVSIEMKSHTSAVRRVLYVFLCVSRVTSPGHAQMLGLDEGNIRFTLAADRSRRRVVCTPCERFSLRENVCIRFIKRNVNNVHNRPLSSLPDDDD